MEQVEGVKVMVRWKALMIAAPLAAGLLAAPVAANAQRHGGGGFHGGGGGYHGGGGFRGGGYHGGGGYHRGPGVGGVLLGLEPPRP